jgi:hypothetical protein
MGLGDPRAIFQLFDLSGMDDLIPGSYVGVVIQAERGPMWNGKPFTNQEQERLIKTYGNSIDWSQDVLCCLKAMEAGANLVVHRIGHCTDISDRSTLDILPASVLIADRGGADTPGFVQSILGPFTFQQALSGRVTGSEIGPFAITTGANDAFKVRVGVPAAWGAEQTVTLQQGAARTAQEVCDNINSGSNGLNATVVAGKIYLEAVAVGNDLEIMAVANDAYSALGFVAGVSAHTEGTDTLIVSIDGDADQTFNLEPMEGETAAFELTSAEVATQLAALTGGVVSGLQGRLTVTSATAGATSTVQVKAGSTCETAFGFDNDVHAGTDGAAKEPWKFEMIGPGAYGNGAKVYVHDSALNSGTAVNVRITCPGTDEEYFGELVRDPASPRYWKNYINAHSDLVKILDVDDPNAAPNDWPALSSVGYTFAGGDDGTLVLTNADWIGDPAGGTGLYCTDHWQMPYIDLMLFGTSSATVKASGIAFVDNHKGRRFYMPTPAGLDAEHSVAWRMGDPDFGYSHAAFDSYKSCSLRGRFKVYDPKNNAETEITALPYLAAAICRTDAAHGRHWSPFGIESGYCPGILGIDDNPAEAPGQADLLAEYQINNARILRTSIETRGFEGAYVWGGWTDQRNKSKLRELQISRKIAEYEWLLYPIGLSFINKPNHPIIWREVHRILDPMFREDLDKGAIFGYLLVTDQDAFFTSGGELKGAVLQTGRSIDQNIYRCRILIQPVPQILYFYFEMGVMRSGDPFVNFSTLYSLPGWARR